MVTDTALWLILVAMIGWIACGCYVTRHDPVRQRFQDRPRGQIDGDQPHAGFEV